MSEEIKLSELSMLTEFGFDLSKPETGAESQKNVVISSDDIEQLIKDSNEKIDVIYQSNSTMVNQLISINKPEINFDLADTIPEFILSTGQVVSLKSLLSAYLTAAALRSVAFMPR